MNDPRLISAHSSSVKSGLVAMSPTFGCGEGPEKISRVQNESGTSTRTTTGTGAITGTSTEYDDDCENDYVNRNQGDSMGGGNPTELERLRVLARIMDEALRVPGTRVRFGLDALIGLIPGIGDMAGGLIACYIILAAQNLGAPNSVLVRMVWNVLVDTAVGAVPFLGDLFDIGYKANRRNVRLLEEFAAAPGKTKRASRAFVAGLLFLVALIVIGGAVVTYLLVRSVWRALS